MHAFPRPEEEFLTVERAPVAGTCPECGSGNLAEYPVLGEGGWWNVRKCQDCLASLERERGSLFGVYVPLGLEILRGEAG
jgi:hypothetical protein